MTYAVYRYFRDDKPAELLVGGLTLEQAQEHCKRDDTHGDDWFDGFTADDDDEEEA